MRSQLQTKPTLKPSFTPVKTGLLQRKCACGNSASLTGKCTECEKKRLSLQRRANNQAEPDRVPPIVHEVLRSPGRLLDNKTRAFMESSFGQDFASVRVHTDGKAAQSAQAVNARAYTVGTDVVFGVGQYAPNTLQGQQLLAHELTHVMQQRDSASNAPVPYSISNPADAAELEADRIAQTVFNNSFPQKVFAASSSSILHRLPFIPGVDILPPIRAVQSLIQSLSDPCGGISKTATYTPTTSFTNPTLGSREFGTTSKLAALFTYGACNRGGNWRFFLNTLDVPIASAIQPDGFRTNVDNANDPVVTRSTYQAIIDDLIPNRRGQFRVSCGGNSFIDSVSTYSRRDTYWKRQLVIDHEAFHRQEWNTMYQPELIRAEQQVWQHSLPASAAPNAAAAIQQARSTLDQYMIAAYQQTCRAYAPQQESRAYNQGAPQYQQLVDQIRSRAAAAGW